MPSDDEPKVSVPTPIQSIAIINKVVVAMYGYKKPIMYKDISAAVGMHPVNVSQALSSARDIGLTELSGKKGLYSLTEKGSEYVRFLTTGKETDAKGLVRELLTNNPVWIEITSFLDATRGQSRDPIDLVLELERKSGKHWSQTMRNRVSNGLVSILEFAEMVVKEGSKIIPIAKKVNMSFGYTEVSVPEEMARKPTNVIPPPLPASDESFANLRGDDFTFEVRRDLNAIAFAKKQFMDWIEYVEKNLERKAQESRQSGGVPNQQQ